MKRRREYAGALAHLTRPPLRIADGARRVCALGAPQLHTVDDRARRGRIKHGAALGCKEALAARLEMTPLEAQRRVDVCDARVCDAKKQKESSHTHNSHVTDSARPQSKKALLCSAPGAVKLAAS